MGHWREMRPSLILGDLPVSENFLLSVKKQLLDGLIA
jgi:hypothetical protein